MEFCQCTKNHMKQVNEHDKETFKSLFNELCYTSTAHHFEKVSSALEAICERSHLSKWWSWWHARHYHIVPAF